jgi:hypothetical protein
MFTTTAADDQDLHRSPPPGSLCHAC